MRVGEKRILNIDEGREVVKERSGGTQSGGGRRVPELWHTSGGGPRAARNLSYVLQILLAHLLQHKK